jgi:hypothetical protein
MSLATHRARSVGELVDATFILYRAHFATMLTVAMIFMAPVALLKGVIPAEFGQLTEIVGNLLAPIAQGAIISIVAAVVERGETLSSGDALRSTTGRGGSLIAVQIASGLMMMIGLVFLIVPGVIALAWTAVAAPVVMIERVGYSKAIERSRELGRGRRKHALGALLLSWGIAFLIISGTGLVLGAVGADERSTEVVGWLVFAGVVPIPTITLALLYYDLRIRTESADLDAMISELPAPAV